mmetsp:Transcript_18771/g.46599  ORF Transcript_18771/g.46599 Transcript_18771/m.46599 type:complete len:311 (+) Transcript_18771:321-1253(+)
MDLSSPESPSHASTPPVQVHGVSAMGLLYLTIIANIWFHHEPDLLDDLLSLHDKRFELSSRNRLSIIRHSHNRTTLASATASLFTHGDWEHVFWNMLLLWMTGKQLFVSKSEKRKHSHHRASSVFSWTSPLAFLWIYLGSQYLASVGCRIICHCLDREWSGRLANNRETWSWQWVPNVWRDTWFTISHGKKVLELRAWQYTPVIGASAAVYGVVGAHLYTAVYCTNHPSQMEVYSKLIWLFKIGMELVETPLTLEQLSIQWRGENIDHASHVCGFLGGFFLAFVWNRIWNVRTKYATRIQQQQRQQQQDA